MEYCCTGFRNMLACAGERGNAVVVWVDSGGELRFLHQSRGVAFEDESKLKPAEMDVVINISAEVGMRYCPTCGRLLEKLVVEHRDFYSNLAKEHEKYLASMPKF
ncbi:hypothetical protein Pan54_24720 [Rubinisphaera italica]|uniref:Uncharacterized protein n=1 Tax=Rubinisphaera italica TaxID=2527969 RepID=A0A5C5XHW3_9PLAN|nr:hypothetical protein Pan54_24720 [Rubinisphaera italica]